MPGDNSNARTVMIPFRLREDEAKLVDSARARIASRSRQKRARRGVWAREALMEVVRGSQEPPVMAYPRPHQSAPRRDVQVHVFLTQAEVDEVDNALAQASRDFSRGTYARDAVLWAADGIVNPEKWTPSLVT